MKKRFFCALLGLALMIGLSGHALAADDITAPVVVDGVEQTNFCATQYGDTTYTSFYGVTLALRPDAVITWENNQLVARGIESGTSWKQKCPFVRPAINRSRKRAEAKMAQVIDDEIAKVMK